MMARHSLPALLGCALLLSAPARSQTPAVELTAYPTALSAAGGKIDFQVKGKAEHHLFAYVVLGSASGTKPGSQLGSVLLPLNYDSMTSGLLNLANTPAFMGAAGFLDSQGMGAATLDVKGPLGPALKGLTLHFSALVVDFGRGTIKLATAPVEVGVVRLRSFNERFITPSRMDPAGTGAKWGSGKLTTGMLGGSGVLGDFDPTQGSTLVGGVYTFNTGDTTIPAECTLTGKPVKITDGVFHFVNFTVPANTEVRFVGPVPAQIFACGKVDVQGSLDVSGHDSPGGQMYNSIGGEKGSLGGLGGPGGGAGGKGGGEPGSGETPQGKSGDFLVVPSGHPLTGKVSATAGLGSAEFPAGLAANLVQYDFYAFFSIQMAAPGGPGGYLSKGVLGSIKATQPSFTTPLGPPVALSGTVTPLPINPGPQVIDQLLIGGSGGGGGGVGPYGSSSSGTDWQHGSGGGGGGGALALRCGGDLVIGKAGTVFSNGGFGIDRDSKGPYSLGGTGSGGTVLMQTAGSFGSTGEIDVSGGGGTSFRDTFSTHKLTAPLGGDGYLRVESPVVLTPAKLGTVIPAATMNNIGSLRDVDMQTGARSLWFSPIGASLFDYYEMDVTVSSLKNTFTDNPLGPNPTRLGVTVAAIFFQGAQFDSMSVPKPGTITRWVTSLADINDPKLNGGKPVPNAVRWTVILDKNITSGQEITVTGIRLFYLY